MTNPNVLAEGQILKDIEGMFAIVELEASLIQNEYIPNGKAHEAKRKERDDRITAFKAAEYRKWILKKAPAYQQNHPELFFNLGRIYALPDESTVKVMHGLKHSMSNVSVADRAKYVQQADTRITDYAWLRMGGDMGEVKTQR